MHTPRSAPPGEGDAASDHPYYYDLGGVEVPLVPADFVAVDLSAAERGGMPPAEIAPISDLSQDLRSGVVLIATELLPAATLERLAAAGALNPVFGSPADGFIVVLPEVRIEATDEDEAISVRTYLERNEPASEVIRDAGQRFVVRPASGLGSDALRLANRVQERVHPAVAQARFLRVMPRPDTSPSLPSGPDAAIDQPRVHPDVNRADGK